MAIVKRIASEGYVDEKALYEANKAVENSPQADWNENDETAINYIKNRTHYENIVETSVVLVDEEIYLEMLPDAYPEYAWSEPITLENGKAYTVTVNDVKQELVCENDELIFDSPDELNNTLTIASEVIYGIREDDYQVKIETTEVSTTLKQLDEKYIPDAIAMVEDIPEINYPVTSVNGQTGNVVIEMPTLDSLDAQPAGNYLTSVNGVTADENGNATLPQPDLSQNDPSAPGYVKNRTHWEEEVKNNPIDTQEFAYNLWGLDGSEIQLSLDKTYRIIFDEIEYECIPYNLTYWEEDGIAIGCSALCGDTNSFGNNEPFLIYYYPSNDFGNIFFKNCGMVHTFSLYSIANEVETTIYENYECDVSDWCSFPDNSWTSKLAIENEGEKYVVVVNDITYELISKYSNNYYCYYVGCEPYEYGVGDDIPFFIADWGDDCWFYTYETGYYDVAVYTLETVAHKLNKKFLPSDMTIAWDNISDKPGGYYENGDPIQFPTEFIPDIPIEKVPEVLQVGDMEITLVSWNGDTTGLLVAEDSPQKGIRMYNVPCDPDLKATDFVGAMMQNSDVDYQWQLYESNLNNDGHGIKFNYSYMYFAYFEPDCTNLNINNVCTVPSTGLWMMKEDDGNFTKIVTKVVHKQFDEAVIPDTIARTSDIPKVPVTSVNGMTGDVVIDIPDAVINPSTATVGQIIVVKAVDTNGKPTEWEAVDMGVLTSPNGTKYKITVTDDGTLSATAVTE